MQHVRRRIPRPRSSRDCRSDPASHSSNPQRRYYGVEICEFKDCLGPLPLWRRDRGSHPSFAADNLSPHGDLDQGWIGRGKQTGTMALVPQERKGHSAGSEDVAGKVVAPPPPDKSQCVPSAHFSRSPVDRNKPNCARSSSKLTSCRVIKRSLACARASSRSCKLAVPASMRVLVEVSVVSAISYSN